MVRNWYVVRLFGTKLFGSVRGTKFGTKFIWFGTWFENLVRCYLVRFEIGDFSVPIWYELLIWFGTDFFRPHFFDLKNVLTLQKKYVRSGTRTEPISDRLIWFVIGSVRNFSINFFQKCKKMLLMDL